MKTIRFIHNLPRSGGTIISKCLGAQKDVNLTGDPNAKNSINIHTEDSLSKKKLIKDGDLNKIKNRADFISLMKDLKGYY